MLTDSKTVWGDAPVAVANSFAIYMVYRTHKEVDSLWAVDHVIWVTWSNGMVHAYLDQGNDMYIIICELRNMPQLFESLIFYLTVRSYRSTYPRPRFYMYIRSYRNPVCSDPVDYY